jgi:hypothetical protein
MYGKTLARCTRAVYPPRLFQTTSRRWASVFFNNETLPRRWASVLLWRRRRWAKVKVLTCTEAVTGGVCKAREWIHMVKRLFAVR